MLQHQVGVIGMAVMGSNLAINLANHQFNVAIYNRTASKTDSVIQAHAKLSLTAFYHLNDFVQSLAKPRKIILMVKAGQAVDTLINQLIPLLDAGDIIIDGGNANFQDTRQRYQQLQQHKLYFFGVGISGGEEGALNGPALMAGGNAKAYPDIAPILEAIAARADDGAPCVAYIGPDGAGHYVKMVHNGIEYGDMQLISEIYALLKQGLNLTNSEMATIFANWNEGELNSYLIDITQQILRYIDPETQQPLIDLILDSAAQKGTGKWTSQNALDAGVPLALITESVFARFVSAQKAERLQAAKILQGPTQQPFIDQNQDIIENIRQALFLSKIISYAQGFNQLQAAAKIFQWPLDYASIARIFRAGCIIRAQFLNEIAQAFEQKAELVNLLIAPHFSVIANQYQKSLRTVVNLAIHHGIAVPALASAITYYDAYRSERLPANLIQAQRDFFGAHGYQRLDQTGNFHTEWAN